MLVVLGIIAIGIEFGHLNKSKVSLLQHRWILTVALALTLGAVFLVMVPTTFRFFIDPNLKFFSSSSIVTSIHTAVAFPAVVLALIYAFGDLPTKVKKWMRITAVLWVASIVLGVGLFLQMMTLI
jgi:uncharacterized membrane protein YozB (DUF420 family)